MDFAIWGILARKACEKPHSNVESLKRSLKKAWADLDEETIGNCCANAHKRLEAVVKAEGRYIEKKYVFCNLEYLLNMNSLNKIFVIWPHDLLMAS